MSTEYGKTSFLLDIEKNPYQKHVNKVAVIYLWRSQRGGEAHEILCGFADGCGWFLGVIFFAPMDVHIHEKQISFSIMCKKFSNVFLGLTISRLPS